MEVGNLITFMTYEFQNFDKLRMLVWSWFVIPEQPYSAAVSISSSDTECG